MSKVTVFDERDTIIITLRFAPDRNVGYKFRFFQEPRCSKLDCEGTLRPIMYILMDNREQLASQCRSCEHVYFFPDH